ncbi:MAG: betaine-aldehyde dehydrogenase [Pseudomonadota bacterium]
MMTSAQPVASHYIGGRYCEDDGGDPIDVTFSGTGEQIARVFAASAEIIDTAMTAAADGQRVWSGMSGPERGRILRRAAELIRERNRPLSELETLDTGKPLQETLVADAASGADALEYFANIAFELNGEHLKFGDDFALTERIPLGVCIGIGAWNYPTQIACWKAAPALACGNAMVFKPSEVTPLCALKIAEILTEAGLPDGVFNVVQGRGEVGHALASHPLAAKVSLTGSVPTGRKVAASAANGPRPVTLELGGKSPIIVFADADIEQAVSGIILGNFYSTGQICSNGTRVFVHRDIRDRLVDRLCERLDAAVIGDPRDEATSLGPLVSERQLEGVLKLIAIGREEGATLRYGGERIARDGAYVEPTVFTDVTDDMTIARDEIFGPVASILSFTDEDDVIRRANDTEFGLAAGVFTRDLSSAHRVIRQLHAGTCWINTYNLTPAGMPFGGLKASGFGRENARAAIEAYSQLRTIYVGMSPVDAPF